MGQEPCFIYAICRIRGEKMCGPVKIGISQDPMKRLRELSTGSPYKLAICVSIMLENRFTALAIEQATHARISAQRLNGEWFEIEPLEATGEISFTLAKCCGYSGRDGEIIQARGDL